WEMEEEAIEDLIIDVFLKDEELKEIHQVHKEASFTDLHKHISLKLAGELSRHEAPTESSSRPL
ncbi:hypothetical protein HAX54_043811, partial [Datura stramonium]|nr:hypothetical protein [Datura stramonium]